MAKVQINDLDAAAALDGTELVEIEQAGQSAQCTTQDIADLAGAPYLKYVALLSQADTDAPVATVLENTLGGTVVWSYDSVGFYIGTLAGAFTENKTTILFSLNDSYILTLKWNSADDLYLSTYNISPYQLADEYLSNTTVEIRVYP